MIRAILHLNTVSVKLMILTVTDLVTSTMQRYTICIPFIFSMDYKPQSRKRNTIGPLEKSTGIGDKGKRLGEGREVALVG
jgi:hypothetical protein